MLNLNLPDSFFVFIGYAIYGLLASTALFLFGAWGAIGLIAFFVLAQIIYRLKTGRWCDWDEALK